MESAVCTLFEGNYHYGLGALTNSLYAHGFRGIIYAGYRGALPPWAKNLQMEDGSSEFNVADGLAIRFIPLQTKIHLTNYKPDFMLDLWKEHCPKAEALFYFDPDIMIKCRWTFFEEWVGAGVAICHNTGAWIPSNHPFRFIWKKILSNTAISLLRESNEYFNGGFVGIKKADREFCKVWANILSQLVARGYLDSKQLSLNKTVNPFNAADQDALNIAVMASSIPISSVGEEGMGFAYGGAGTLMLHAIGTPKPWEKNFLRLAVSGRAPRRADKAFFEYAETPIALYTQPRMFLRRFDLFCGKVLGRLF
jgi:hypothetical protein